MSYTVPMPPSRQEVNEEYHRKQVKKAHESYMKEHQKMRDRSNKNQVAY